MGEPWGKIPIEQVRSVGPGEVFPQILIRLDELCELVREQNRFLEKLARPPILATMELAETKPSSTARRRIPSKVRR